MTDQARLTDPHLRTPRAAAFAGIVMAVNFHLSKGSTHPWILPRDGFDESVDLDSLLPLIQGVFIWVSVATWLRLRRVARVSLETRHLAPVAGARAPDVAA